jgi:hypothetical protein
LHPPDVQLQVRPPGGEWVQTALSAPGKVAAQIGLSVIPGGALETGQVGSHCQPQLISERRQVIDRDRQQFGEVHHAQTLRPGRREAREMCRVRQMSTFAIRAPMYKDTA